MKRISLKSLSAGMRKGKDNNDDRTKKSVFGF
jgi:hypothetical protein